MLDILKANNHNQVISHKSKLPDVRQAQSFPGYVLQSPYSNFIPTLVYTGQLWYIQVNSGIYSQLWYIQVNSLPFLLCPFPLTLSKKISYAKINCIRQTASDKLHQTKHSNVFGKKGN